ncbi:hypothetical protein H6784_01550 [Candidatus Nomurabacteria bacterium]|nr:hypothetical protein [Candidatus Kaiserbacteria bacterium]MCB9814079.1 hypothetical protein [Candidatus Nomurabacteria bacterium]
MANDSSLGDVKQFTFDLDSQKGIAHLLASVRASDISAAEKNELRDLIFLYSNGGKDQTVRITLEQKIVFYGVVPVTVAVVPGSAPAFSFGVSRPAPTTFSATAVTRQVVNPAPAASPVQTQPPTQPSTQPQVPVVPTEIAQPPVVPVTVPTPTPEVVIPPSPAPTVQVPVTPAPPVIPEPVTQDPVIPAPAPVTPPVAPPQPSAPISTPPVTQPPVTPISAPTPPVAEPNNYDPGEYLQRIREIKSIVNDKVGNPVNLVDINNEVGREYMGALLDAMKKLNSGSSALSAMKRLETAFIEVKNTIEEYEKNPTNVVKSSPVATPQSVPQTENKQPIPETFSPPIQVPISPQPSIPDSPVVAPYDIPAPVPVRTPRVIDFGEPSHLDTNVPNNLPSSPASLNAGSENLIASSWGPDTDTVRSNKETPVSVNIPVPVPDTPASFEPPKAIPVQTTVDTPAVPPITQTPATPIVPDAPVSPLKASSLAESGTKLHTPNDLPLASDIKTSSVVGDPLFIKEVDDGLQQLLVEWSLFKKSGLFGTGPKGREHPLFKKLAPLQIPLLLAGRFEGATQEIKQSITDYMNGWRYEQGIVYESGETFEHYLRRVIRHILDLQK